jgi:NAD(P)-dependent dehydrogenase (short-subunit alcohol dehydrogenase family)
VQLQDAVAVVTGASRGAGRAIALELGGAGATVYVTGRSIDPAATTDNLPGTIHETAREVTERGGRGIAVRCDHTVDAQVDALFREIAETHGGLDLLVNNVWGGYEDSQCRPLPQVPFWEQPLQQWDRMFTAGVRTHLTASRLAVPLMVPRKRGLIVTTTANLEPLPYMRNIFYDMAKNAVTRMTRAMALELRDHGIAAVAVAPGFMRTERIVEAFRRAGAEAALDGPGGPGETPFYLGRAVVALAQDERILEKSGQLLEVGALAREYGFTDVNGRQPAPFRKDEQQS